MNRDKTKCISGVQDEYTRHKPQATGRVKSNQSAASPALERPKTAAGETTKKHDDRALGAALTSAPELTSVMFDGLRLRTEERE